jgi:CubicO group peptidase (beta-lactamase class C family)
MKLRSKPYFPTVGWLEDFPQRHGLDGGRLLAMRQHIEARLPHIRSVAVARHGYVLFEMYRQGFGRDSLLDLASVTKTVTALAFGIAIGQGILRLDERIVERYPGLVASADARAEQLTVEHLLAMTAGFDWSDAHVRSWRLAEDQPRFPLRHAFKDTPGVVFNYDTPASHLLAGVLHQACGQTLLEFCDTHLFGPLGITQRSWQQDAEGYSYAGHGLSLNTRDALKLGLLCLRGGIWDGRRVLPEGWVARMTMAHSPGYPDTFGAYGYLCWIQPVREHASYYAAGSGGQYLHMIPDLDLLVLVTSNHDRLHAENKQLVRDFVVPAVLDSTMEPQCDGA